MELTTRLATREDLDELVSIYVEMERHFCGPDYTVARDLRDRLELALFGHRPSSEAVIAISNQRIVGLSLISLLFPGDGASTTAFIMELFVSATGRGSGVGRTLMSALIDLALERGYSRLEWTTEAHNSSAQEFYRRYGAAEVNRVFYRLDQKSLQGNASGTKR